MANPYTLTKRLFGMAYPVKAGRQIEWLKYDRINKVIITIKPGDRMTKHDVGAKD